MTPAPKVRAPDRAEVLTQFALDIARELVSPEIACMKNGLTFEEGKELLENDAFAALLRGLKSEWLETGNTLQRAQLKAGAALEDGIEQLYRMVMGQGGGPDGKPMAVQVEAVKALARIAGIGGSAAGGFAGAVGGVSAGVGAPVFKLVINLGEGEKLKTIEGAISREPAEDEGDTPKTLGDLLRDSDD